MNITINYLTLHGIIAAIKPQRKLLHGKDIPSDTNEEDTFAINFFQACKRYKRVYNKLISLKQTSPAGRSLNKWIVDCNQEFPESIYWNAVYQTPFCCTKASKLIVFKFKLLHTLCKRLATNDYLHKLGLKNDDICAFFQRSFFLSGKDFQSTHKASINNKTNEIFHRIRLLRLNIDVFSYLQHYFYFLVARYFMWTM